VIAVPIPQFLKFVVGLESNDVAVICDLCEVPAPFKNMKNEAYLECHHIWLAKGGEDTASLRR